MFKWIALFAVSLIVSPGVASGKEWRGIVPLKSTRADVERLLGPPKLTSYSGAYYSLAKEIVVVEYQPTACNEDRFGLGWNVPVGTVVGIGVIPKGTHRPQEYQLASGSRIEDRGAGFMYYGDSSAGLGVETYKDRVTLVEYYPELAQEQLRCPRLEKCCVDTFTKFDEYQQLPFADEKARLDNFQFNMNSLVARGTIEVLGPSKSARQEHMKAAIRAKTYLVKQRGVEPERILIVDAGFSPVPLIRLNDYSIGGFASSIWVAPQPDPGPHPARSRSRESHP